jgi:uncharacterized protein (TIGR02271 family)
MRWDKNNVREGMFVTSTKGERIGKVIRSGSDTFVVEKGALFPKDYELRYDHITDVRNGGITYSLVDFFQREERLQRAAVPPATAAAVSTSTPDLNAARLAAAKVTAAPRLDDKEVRIPLMREELEVDKVNRESGHVKIHKSVKSEEKHFTVPVRREEIVIEHVTSFAGSVGAEGAEFREETLDIPLHEEEVRISKHPVLREEVVIRMVAHSVEKEASAILRHEEAEVEDSRKPASISTSPSTSPSASTSAGYGAPGRR